MMMLLDVLDRSQEIEEIDKAGSRDLNLRYWGGQCRVRRRKMREALIYNKIINTKLRNMNMIMMLLSFY